MCQCNEPPAMAACLRAARLVEQKIHTKIRVSEMAAAAGYSLFSFIRLFNGASGLSPYDYQMKRKLTCARCEVVTSARKITDIALDYGFETPEGFSRAFFRYFGSLPSTLRNGKFVDPRIGQKPISVEYLQWASQAKSNPPSVRDQQERILTGIGQLSTCIGDAIRRSYSEPSDSPQLALIDYWDGWINQGPQMVVENGVGPLTILVSAGEYLVFDVNLPIGEIDSFLHWYCCAAAAPPTNVVLALAKQSIIQIQIVLNKIDNI